MVLPNRNQSVVDPFESTNGMDDEAVLVVVVEVYSDQFQLVESILHLQSTCRPSGPAVEANPIE